MLIKDYPEYWSAYNNLALAYFYLGKIEKADNILDRRVWRKTQEIYMPYVTGNLYLLLSEDKEVKKCCWNRLPC